MNLLTGQNRYRLNIGAPPYGRNSGPAIVAHGAMFYGPTAVPQFAPPLLASTFAEAFASYGGFGHLRSFRRAPTAERCTAATRQWRASNRLQVDRQAEWGRGGLPQGVRISLSDASKTNQVRSVVEP
jgi:hypothetical protein